MNEYLYVLITIYLCVNCFYSGAEWANNGYTIWFMFGFLFFIPMYLGLFLWYFIKLLMGKEL